jgi:hexosaminidase
MKKTALFLCLALYLSQLSAQSLAVIPLPAQWTYTRSLPFRLNAQSSISAQSPEAKTAAAYLAEKLQPATGFKLKTNKAGNIVLRINQTPNPTLGNEGYTLEVTQQKITLQANQSAGLFYGVQTLLQLLPPEIESPTRVTGVRWNIPGIRITDYPRFGWRGLMLDVSRHFFTKAEVKKYIDRMARYKYNIFHWHLTDDQGWRIEIKSRPKLTEVGACRVQRYGKWGTYEAPQAGEQATDCGFYTQDDIREIVAYAANLHIQVLPEIDVPGHSSAAIASYPELCCTRDTNMRVSPGHKFSEWYGNGQFKMLIDNSLNPANEDVYRFLEDVFGEVAGLFPFPYIHMGGDEAYHGYWEADSGCQALMAKEGLKSTHELQSYFVKRVEKILAMKGKKLIGWDEILDGGLAPEATVMSWQGVEGGIAAAKQGHYAVMSPNDFTYIDLIQGDAAVEPDATAYKKVRLKKAYEYEPLPDSIDPKFILGCQANLWSEKAPTYRHAEYLSYPRAWALADVFWSPKASKNWPGFINRMENHFQRADAANMNYARSAYDAIVAVKNNNGQMSVELSTELPELDIFYTLNETTPDAFTTPYTGPILIPQAKAITLKVVTCRNGKPIGKVIALSKEELTKRMMNDK